MSDIFDHMADAYDSLYNGQDPSCSTYSRGRDYTRDPLYYHEKVTGFSVEATTEKAYLLKIPMWYRNKDSIERWIPKKWIRSLDIVGKSCYIWKEGYHKAIRNN